MSTGGHNVRARGPGDDGDDDGVTPTPSPKRTRTRRRTGSRSRKLPQPVPSSRPPSARNISYMTAIAALVSLMIITILFGVHSLTRTEVLEPTCDDLGLEEERPGCHPGRASRCAVDLRVEGKEYMSQSEVTGLVPRPPSRVDAATQAAVRKHIPTLFESEAHDWALTPAGNICWDYDRDTGTPDRCLPSFFLGGPTKGGTTDLWGRLRWHPQVSGNREYAGEFHYWSRRLYPALVRRKTRIRMRKDHDEDLELEDRLWKMWRDMSCDLTLDEYASIVADFRIFPKNNQLRQWNPDKLMMGEYSSSYLYDIGLINTTLTVPDVMATVIPNAKMIFTLRDPVDRLFSDFFFFNRHASDASQFTERCSNHLQKLQLCLAVRNEHDCFVDVTEHYHFNSRCRIEVGVYAVYLDYWIRALGRENVLIVRSECFFSDPKKHMQRVFEFLGLDEPDEKAWRYILQPITGNKNTNKPKAMEPEIESKLRAFYQPYEDRLEQLMPGWKECV